MPLNQDGDRHGFQARTGRREKLEYFSSIKESGAWMAMWPADQVERWSIDRLIPYARNARQHSDSQVAQIAASIREWGWTMPILADEEGGVIAGHGRLLGARKLGLPDVPVMVAR